MENTNIDLTILSKIEAINRNLKAQIQLIEDEYNGVMREFNESKNSLEKLIELFCKQNIEKEFDLGGPNCDYHRNEQSFRRIISDILKKYSVFAPKMLVDLMDNYADIVKIKEIIKYGITCIKCTEKYEDCLY